MTFAGEGLTSGFEVCRRLKRDKATAHIPVVIMTSRSTLRPDAPGSMPAPMIFLSMPINEITLPRAGSRSSSRLRLILDELRSRALRWSKLGIGSPFTQRDSRITAPAASCSSRILLVGGAYRERLAGNTIISNSNTNAIAARRFDSSAALLRRADRALYRSKQDGRNRVSVDHARD